MEHGLYSAHLRAVLVGGGWLQRQLDHPSKAFYSSNAGSVFFTRHLHLNNDSSGQIASQFSCFPAEDQGLPPLKDFSDVTIRFILSAAAVFQCAITYFPRSTPISAAISQPSWQAMAVAVAAFFLWQLVSLISGSQQANVNALHGSTC